ncbi:hypothetical protein DFR70_12543 [Nocardia tenerifensis]|uniref:Uncharacterized protein n=1 Tax=Nocardia tenerifensis TaxID=228006 RepID=A0A318JP65_9NOCA|nr:hypothetical protein DFR70_12543 [Nocardia tenerifensis]
MPARRSVARPPGKHSPAIRRMLHDTTGGPARSTIESVPLPESAPGRSQGSEACGSRETVRTPVQRRIAYARRSCGPGKRCARDSRRSRSANGARSQQACAAARAYCAGAEQASPGSPAQGCARASSLARGQGKRCAGTRQAPAREAVHGRSRVVGWSTGRMARLPAQYCGRTGDMRARCSAAGRSAEVVVALWVRAFEQGEAFYVVGGGEGVEGAEVGEVVAGGAVEG